MHYDKDSIVKTSLGFYFSDRFLKSLFDRVDVLRLQGQEKEAQALEAEFELRLP